MKQVASPNRKASAVAPVRAAGLLIVGDVRFQCSQFEPIDDGFAVVILASVTFEKSQPARLLIDEAICDVQISGQTEVQGGVKLTLHRLTEERDEPELQSCSWLGSAARSISVVAALVCLCASVCGGVSYETVRQACHSLISSNKIQKSVDAADAKTSQPSSEEIQPSSADVVETSPAEIPGPTTLPVSLATGRRSEDSIVELDDKSRGLVRASLDSIQLQRCLPMNVTSLPWLFTLKNGEPGLKNCRMSAIAAGDLKAFNSGLQSLTPKESGEAISSLRQALERVAQSPTSQTNVPGMAGVRRSRSVDADIYFRIVNAQAEVLRVLPIELGADASHSIRRHRTAAHR